jgi:8-oxo-dGTP pyrophosphatase MutT (NUDIX family)
MKAVALGLIRRGDRWFLQRRDPAGAVLPGLWEFPGGKVEPGETTTEALVRELLEELQLTLKSAQAGPVLVGLPPLHAFFVEAVGTPHTHLAWGWFTLEEALRLPIPPRNRDLIERIRGPRNFGPASLI